VSREGEFDAELALLFDGMTLPGALYALERHFWLELWRVPILEAIEEHGTEARHYGPIRAFAFPPDPRQPLFNIVLGADRPGAVADGHLAEALEWTASLGLDCRIPVRQDSDEFCESGAAESLLERRGYRRSGALAAWARGLSKPAFPAPAGIEVEELVDETAIETFDGLLEQAYGADRGAHSFFLGLPGRRDWRTYLALDDEGPIAAAAMMMHYQVPQLAFTGTLEEARGQGAHLALLHRRIEDARAARARELFAITEEPLECPENLSAGARNLIRAGFQAVGFRTVWRPPEELLRREEDGEDEEGWGEDDGDGGGEGGLDEDHDFTLEG